MATIRKAAGLSHGPAIEPRIKRNGPPKTAPFLLHFGMMAAMTVMNNHHAFRMSAVPAALSAITVT
jgi:hypothetical protein